MIFTKNIGEPIYAALNGKVIAITDLDEPIFAGKVVGDGVAIIPTDGTAVSPVSGIVSFIAQQKHSYGITTFDGVEVLLHLGIGTVKLEGQGFTPLVRKGDQVKVGTALCSMDLDLLKQKGIDPTSPLIITSNSSDRIKKLTLITGQATAGSSICMRYVTQDK